MQCTATFTNQYMSLLLLTVPLGSHLQARNINLYVSIRVKNDSGRI